MLKDSVLAQSMALPELSPATQAVLRPVSQPQGSSHVLFEHFWVEAGAQPLPEPTDRPHFVMTPSVRGHLRNLARAALVRRFPILLQARLMRLHSALCLA